MSPGGVAKTPNLDTLWTADRQTLSPAQPVTLTWDNGAGLVFKRVVAVDDKYMFTITDSVVNSGPSPATVQPYGLILRHGRPNVAGYSVLHEGFVGVITGDGASQVGLTLPVQEVTYSAIEKDTGRVRAYKGDGGWLGFTDKYWGSAVIPEQTAPIEARFSASGTVQPVDYQADFLGKEQTVAPGGRIRPRPASSLARKRSVRSTITSSSLGIKKFSLMIDWGWFWMITMPMFRLLDAIYKVVGNFGVAIIIVTVLVKLAFFPLANRSYNSMAKMKKIQPQIAALKDLYPDDKVKQQQEQMALFKREGVNPVAGCLPMVIQIPVFFALYKVIFITIEMRHAPFFGWIRDLSAPRSDQRVHPVRLHSLGPDRAAGLRPFPPPRHLAARHGRVDVLPDEDESRASRSGSKADVLLDAGDLHLHARHVSGWPGHLLDLEQHADGAPAVLHHDQGGREG